MSLVSTTHMHMNVGAGQPTSKHLSTKVTLPPPQSSPEIGPQLGMGPETTFTPSKSEVWLALHHTGLIQIPIAAVGS